jgi:universal stress protein A
LTIKLVIDYVCQSGTGNNLVSIAVFQAAETTAMNGYTHILVGIDLSNEANQVLERAAQIAGRDGATLSVVHVIEPLSYAYGGDLPLDFSGIQEEIQRQSLTRMEQVGQKFSVASSQLHIVTGRPEREIHRLAQQIKADLVVVGTHGRHGLALLLGSTANGVLHGTPCDVLAVKVKDAT